MSTSLLPSLIYRFIFAALALVFTGLLQAQTLRGVVRNVDNGRPVAGATVILRNNIAPFSQTSDADGAFIFENLRPGYYACEVTMPGFESQTISEINLVAGKEQVLTLALQHSVSQLPELLITANQPGRRTQQPLAEIPLSRDQTLRFPATFFDPARLAMAYPGVSGNDDQANGLSIRGNNPASVRWKMEGLDVVNPNHLPNAGTFSDRPAAASGGVLMFSAQMLDNSALLTGNYPAGYADALGGVMDMNLRRGNTHQHEFTAQAGLIGLDMAAEGPLFGQGKNSYLINYRYSTVGLLNQLGIPLGDEQIHFQDLSFKLHFSGKKGGEWSVFGMGGLNDNIFKRKDSSDVAHYKDLFNINFDSKTFITGASYWKPLGARTWMKIAYLSSGQISKRDAASDNRRELDRQEEGRSGLSLTLQRRFNDQWRLSGGGNIQSVFFEGNSYITNVTRFTGAIQGILWQPWVNAEWSAPNRNWTAQLGLQSNLYNSSWHDDDRQASIEPRASLTWRPGSSHRFTLAYGWYSQLNPLWLKADYRGELPPPEQTSPNRLAGLVKSRQLGLRHTWQWGEAWALKSELFLHRMSDIQVSTLDGAFSMFNITEIAQYDSLTPRGIAENKGLEINLERYITGGWFMAANATLFDSRYQGSDGAWRASRWDLGHIFNVTAGREWQRTPRSDEKIKVFGVNGRLTYTGGYRVMPVDLDASRVAGETRFITTNGWSQQLPGYFRLDLRVYWKRNLGNRRNSTFAMDFQNATMQKNVAYYFYDPYTDQVEKKLQLGLIPNASWRLEF